MPGMETSASLRAVRDCFEKQRIAVVSGSKSRCAILAALDAGVHGYVPKELGVSELTHALKLIVDGVIYVGCPAELFRYQPAPMFLTVATIDFADCDGH